MGIERKNWKNWINREDSCVCMHAAKKGGRGNNSSKR